MARQCPRASRRQHEVLQRRPETHACRIRKVRDLRHTQTCTGERAFVTRGLVRASESRKDPFQQTESDLDSGRKQRLLLLCTHLVAPKSRLPTDKYIEMCLCALLHPSIHSSAKAQMSTDTQTAKVLTQSHDNETGTFTTPRLTKRIHNERFDEPTGVQNNK